MNKKLVGIILTTLIIFAAMIPVNSSATDVRTATTTYGLKVGLTSPGTWYVGDFEYDPDMSYSFGGFLDYKLGPKISGGAALNFHGISAYETSNFMLDLGITIKALLYKETSDFTFRPGIGISYGSLGKMDIYAATNYMLLKGTLEVIYTPAGSNISWLGDIGLWGAPNGGNDDFEAYFDAGLILRGGIIF